MMDNSCMDYDKILYRPFKIVNPDSFEVQYLLMKVIWNLGGRPSHKINGV